MNLYRRPEMCVANKQRKTSLLQNEANKLFVFKRRALKTPILRAGSYAMMTSGRGKGRLQPLPDHQERVLDAPQTLASQKPRKISRVLRGTFTSIPRSRLAAIVCGRSS